MSRIDYRSYKTITLDNDDYYQLEQKRYVLIKNENETIMIRR